ncbi:MAG: sugar MFS transporter [Deltaproteobacteria bacterium]|nr:sugar MFS transporter [Deltaproteobacteria bacterium]
MAFISVTALFFLWGFITCLNDILVPHLKGIFSLDYAGAMMVQFAFFSAYFFFSLPAGYIVKRFGYPNGLLTGLFIAGIGAFAFYPASLLHSYEVFLASLFILACGITLLQIAANPYAAALGPPEKASARLNFAQAFNSLGTTIAPTIGSYFVLGGAAHSPFSIFQSSTDLPYLGITLLLFAMILALRALSLPSLTDASLERETAGGIDRGHALRYANLRWGVMAIFFYVGAEVGLGSMLVNYIASSWTIEPYDAGYYVGFYWGGAMAGRFVGTYFLNRFRAELCLGVSGLFATVCILLGILGSQGLSPYFLLIIGIFNSIMFPVIFSLSIKNLGRHTSQGSSFLCMAVVGGAIMPLLQGFVADAWGIRLSFVLPLLSYTYICWYAGQSFFKGSEWALTGVKTEGASHGN